MPQQGPGYGMHPSFGNFINDPTAQIGFQMGKTAMDAGQQYMEQNVCHTLTPFFLALVLGYPY